MRIATRCHTVSQTGEFSKNLTPKHPLGVKNRGKIQIFSQKFKFWPTIKTFIEIKGLIIIQNWIKK